MARPCCRHPGSPRQTAHRRHPACPDFPLPRKTAAPGACSARTWLSPVFAVDPPACEADGRFRAYERLQIRMRADVLRGLLRIDTAGAQLNSRRFFLALIGDHVAGAISPSPLD